MENFMTLLWTNKAKYLFFSLALCAFFAHNASAMEDDITSWDDPRFQRIDDYYNSFGTSPLLAFANNQRDSWEPTAYEPNVNLLYSAHVPTMNQTADDQRPGTFEQRDAQDDQANKKKRKRDQSTPENQEKKLLREFTKQKKLDNKKTVVLTCTVCEPNITLKANSIKTLLRHFYTKKHRKKENTHYDASNNPDITIDRVKELFTKHQLEQKNLGLPCIQPFSYTCACQKKEPYTIRFYHSRDIDSHFNTKKHQNYANKTESK